MADQQELRVLLRTVADTHGAAELGSSLSRVRQEAQRSEGGISGLGRGFELSRESALRFVGALTGVEIGLSVFTSVGEAIRRGLEASSEAFVESARVARATAASYGVNADQFTRFAKVLSEETGFTSDAILEAAISARTLSDNYGLSIDQTQKLIRVSADLAQVRGIGVAEAFDRVQAAIRGEGRASAELGLALTDQFVQQNAANGAYRETYTTLTTSQRAQVVYNEILRQSAQFTGLAAASTDTLEGAQRRAATATFELQRGLGEVLAPVQTELLRVQADQFERLATAIQKARDASKAGPPSIANPEQREQLELQAEAVRGFQAAVAAVPGAIFAATPFGQFLQGLQAASAASRAVIPQLEVGRANVTVIGRALQDIHDRTQQLAAVAQLPFVGMDETAKSADLSINRLRSDMEELRKQSSDATSLINALGQSAGTSMQRAALAAANDLRSVDQTINALKQSAQGLRQLETIASQVSDPRDAIGGSNRIAQERLRLLDQLEPAERALADARQRQNDLTTQGLQLQAQEAAATFSILPQREALQDVQSQLQRDRLLIQVRGLDPATRSGARRDIRNLNRNVLPGAELAAFDADRLLVPIQRAEERNRLQGQIGAAGVGAAQSSVDAIIDRAIAAGVKAAADNASKPAQQIIVNITDESGTTKVLDQLIEANGQAQTPPVIQVSAVRR